MSSDKPYVVTLKSEKVGEVLIYQPIGNSFWEEGVTAKQFATDIKTLGNVTQIDVRINSPGGSMNDGLAIYNVLNQHKARVNVYIDGIALSMASVIAMAGDSVAMAENALMMIHNPQWIAVGDAHAMRKAADTLDMYKQSVIAAYESKSGMAKDEISSLMDDETWFTATEAVDAKFADVVTEALDIAASVDFQNLPYGLAAPEAVLARRPVVSQREDKDMSADATPQAATLEQLEALNGADEKFVIAQLKAKATLADAVNALNAKLAAEIEELRSKPQQPAPAQQAPAPVQQSTNAEGVEPMANNTAPKAAGETTPPDVMAEYTAKFRELRARGISAAQACTQVWRDNPHLAKAALESHAAKTGRTY